MANDAILATGQIRAAALSRPVVSLSSTVDTSTHMIRDLPGIKQLTRVIGLAPKETAGHFRQFLLDMLPRHSVGAEIGVLSGNFSKQVLDSISPRQLHLIDPWEHQTSGEYKDAWYGGAAKRGQAEMDERYADVLTRFKRKIRSGQVQVHRGYSAAVLEQFPDHFFDWVYIDGNHLYEYVKKDLELSLRKVKLGGYITGDDYTEGGWWEGGVKKAVDELAENPAVQLLELRDSQFVFLNKGSAAA